VKKYESILKSKIYHNAKQRINLQGIMQETLGTINDVLSLSLYIYIYISLSITYHFDSSYHLSQSKALCNAMPIMSA
jgi:hypothetical protein